MPDPPDHPPDKKRARIPRGTWDALRMILTLFTLLHHWRNDC